MIPIAALTFLSIRLQTPITQPQWTRVVSIDPKNIETEDDFNAELKHQRLTTAGYTNWFVGQWPYLSFLGGTTLGNVSEDLEFFYEKPFKWSTRVFDNVLEGGGKKFGIRATIRPYRNDGTFPGGRSYLIDYECDRLLEEYHPSYILANGRRVWDSRRDPILDGKILVPFWQDKDGDPVIDFVTDLAYTPKLKGLALRSFDVQYLGAPGDKVSFKGVSESAEASPAASEQRFAFGVFPSELDFWSDRGTPLDDLVKAWRPNFHPAYPTDSLWLSPFAGASPGRGAYHDFMVTYGGCNILGADPSADVVAQAGSYARGVLASTGDVAGTKRALQLNPSFEVQWLGEEEGPMLADSGRSDPQVQKQVVADRDAVQSAKVASGAPNRISAAVCPYPAGLTSAFEFDSGRDVLVFKNESDPQYNLMMAMARGAGRAYNKPFGFYWDETHAPALGLDFKLQACLLYYFSGGSWIGAQGQDAPSFDDGIAAEWVLPYIKALRFAMVHPSRGTPIVPTAVCWGGGDRWWLPFAPLGQLDNFQRSISYDHATKTFTCEPAFTNLLPWMPSFHGEWGFATVGHLRYFYDHVPELTGYDLLDVFFPGYGDALTAKTGGLLTGTPYGPIDLLNFDQASPGLLQTYGLTVFLGKTTLNVEARRRLLSQVEAGQNVVVGAEQIGEGQSLSGLKIPALEPTILEGPIESSPGFLSERDSREFKGQVYLINPGPDWEVLARVGERQWPLLVRRPVGAGFIYAYLGKWIGDGGSVLRPLLNTLGTAVAPIRFGPADNQIEYMAYRKNGGAWAAIFNHGAIPIGADRLKTLRATPPEPLSSEVKGPWKGEIVFRLAQLGLDPAKKYGVYQVEGIDGAAFDEVVSGHSTFAIHAVPFVLKNGELHIKALISKRSEFVVALPGQAHQVFFGG